MEPDADDEAAAEPDEDEMEELEPAAEGVQKGKPPTRRKLAVEIESDDGDDGDYEVRHVPPSVNACMT